MLELLAVIAGAAAGCAVCAFGMWAFLKGQRAGLAVNRGGIPENLFEGTAEHKYKKECASPSLSEQIGSLFKSEGGE